MIYKNAAASGEHKKRLVPTDKDDNVIANKQFLGTIINKYAGIDLDLGKVKLSHPDDEIWTQMSDLVHQDLYFSLAELADGYIRKYLGKVVKDNRHEWYRFYKETGGRKHPKCKVEWFVKLKVWWEIKEFKSLSNQMMYAKSCSLGGKEHPPGILSEKQEFIESCPELMDHSVLSSVDDDPIELAAVHG